MEWIKYIKNDKNWDLWKNGICKIYLLFVRTTGSRYIFYITWNCILYLFIWKCSLITLNLLITRSVDYNSYRFSFLRIRRYSSLKWNFQNTLDYLYVWRWHEVIMKIISLIVFVGVIAEFVWDHNFSLKCPF